MANLMNNLILEIEKFNMMVENNDGNTFNDLIYEQSIKLDDLILSYTKLKLEIIHNKLEILHQFSTVKAL